MNEPFIILAGHQYIYVIIPWDITFMAHSTDKSAVSQKIFQGMLIAIFCETVKDIQCNSFLFRSIDIFHIVQ